MQDPTSIAPAFKATMTIEEMAALAFLVRYKGDTRYKYTNDLRFFFEWCAANGLPPLEAKRVHLELYARHLEDDRGNCAATVHGKLSTLCGFYRIAQADDYVVKDPTVFLRMPKVSYDETRALGLDRHQLGKLLQVASASSPSDGALFALMGLMGLRVSEACAVQIEDFQSEIRGHRVLQLTGKGGKDATMPIPVPVLRALVLAAGDRTTGPVVLTKAGKQQNRRGAYGRCKILVKRAGLPVGTHPHTMRHAAITAALDAGAPLRDAQVFARHSDPRITTRYDRGRQNLDRHAAHLVSAYIAGGTIAA